MAAARTSKSQHGRAGVYVRQPTGYQAFHPKPLPPQPPVRLDGELQTILSDADRSLGRLDGAIQTLPNPDLFVLMYVRREAVLSSQIEGTQSSLQDVLAAEAQVFSPDRPKDVQEVINYVRALNYGLERLTELPVSVRLICEIHRELMQGVRGSELTPGEIRTSQNWIGPQGCSLGDAVYVPPPASEVRNCLAEWERFHHSCGDLPLLVRLGLLHAQFETIHPFLDGNGRVGRLLLTFLLCESRVLAKPVLYLSHYFQRYKQDYYAALQAVRDDGAWERWIQFFLTGVHTVSQQATLTARKILALREDHRDRITARLGRVAGNGHRILESLYEKPLVSVKQIQELIGTSYPAANSIVRRLEDCGILVEITGNHRNRRYFYQPYVDLFLDD